VTLCFDVEGSVSLSHAQKSRLRAKLANRIGRDGVLRVVSSKERTQLANRRAAVARLIELMRHALHVPKPRRKTRPPASASRKRLESKAKRGEVKRTRQSKIRSDD
jgi:ribosome-associated protein